jgi:hypothetical protein
MPRAASGCGPKPWFQALRVTLDVAEGKIARRDNELIHIGMVEIAAHQGILLVRLSPPARHL